MAIKPINVGYSAASVTDGSTPAALVQLIWRAAPLLLVLAVSAIELILADRKYGLFTGGFGQSRAIDSVGELAIFGAGYVLVQVWIGLVGWWLAVKLMRGRAAWTALFLFMLVNGVLFCGLLAAQYQLHSYFSDAVGFALIKQLGGGSVADALLYSVNEISIALGALSVLAIILWLVWKVLTRWLADQTTPARPPRLALSGGFAVLALLALFAIPRGGSDAAYGLNRTLAWQGLNKALNFATDVDGDGYGLFAVQYDRAPFDGARHPLALDIPGNGVDEDGYGGDLQLTQLSELLPPARLRPSISDAPPKHLVLVVIETLRGDVLGKRINGKVVAPNLEALAAGGDMVPTYSHVGFTSFSLKSLFAGRLIAQKGDPTLFSDLAQNGYRIGVYSGQAEDFGDIAAVTGMRRHASSFVDSEVLKDKRAFGSASKASLKVDEKYLLEAFDEAMGSESWSLPHFIYFNFQAAHFPYFHSETSKRIAANPLPRSEISSTNVARVQETYWNAVAHADAALGQLIARLKAKSVWDDTLLLVTGDHGEDLFEDGFLGHGHIINQRQYRTLLVSNKPSMLPNSPIALADYRAVITGALQGQPPAAPAQRPFLRIGPLDSPTAIGMAGPDGQLTSLRLDTGEACLVEQGRCAPNENLEGIERQRINTLVARWGSERWRAHLQLESKK